MIGSFFGEARTLPAENRKPAPKPWNRKEYAKQFDAYFADRTGGRRDLVGLRNRILLDAFDESPTPLVIAGKDGWLYLNTGFDPLDPNASQDYEIEVSAKVLRDRAAWCRERGIKYVVQVAREKHMIYPGYLPDRMRHAVDSVPLLQAACPEVTILDPRPLLLSEPEPVYYRLDTHWTTLGAVIGYRQVADELERTVTGYHGKARNQFTARSVDKKETDLAVMMGFPLEQWVEPTTWMHQPAIVHETEPSVDLAAEPGRLTHIDPLRLTSPATNGLHLMLLHDSFGHTYRDYLAGDVTRFTALGTYGFPKDWIGANKPDVVVQLFVERALMTKSHAIR